MIRGMSDLRRLSIAATDGDLGRVGDVYFDDRSWRVRYLGVDGGNGLPGGRLLVPPIAVRSSDSPSLHVPLTRQQIAASPDASPRGLPGSSAPQGGADPANLAPTGESGDGHLHPATAVMGWAIQTEDGEIGHVKDVLVDDEAWAIKYLVVDTEKGWAGKKVLVSPAWLGGVRWDASRTLWCIATAIDDSGESGRAGRGSSWWSASRTARG